MVDDITLTIGNQAFGGWTAMSCTRGIEQMPSHFTLTLTDRYPGQTIAPPQQAGDPVTLSLGPDAICVGYIDRLIPQVTARSHEIHIMGRGQGADLVDCPAIADNSQFLNKSIGQIASAVAAPFGINVIQRDPGKASAQNPMTDTGLLIPQLTVGLTDTAWSIIETCSRFAGLLAYESADGNVILSNVGTAKHASGFKLGVNVQSASVMFATDARYSDYIGVGLNVLPSGATLPAAPGNAGDANTIITEYDNPMLALTRKDGSLRRRPYVIVSESGMGNPDILKMRVKWEMSRRYGRGNVVSLVTDTWRDSAGSLWTPNVLVDVDLPQLHLPLTEMLIADVTFSANLASGRTATLTLMPAAAFAVAPPPVLFDGQTHQAAQGAQQ